MWSLCVIATLALSFSVERSFAEFPTNVHRCAYGDFACISQSMQYVITNFARTGVKEMNIIPFDPLHVKSLKLERNPSSPVNIELAFKDVEVLGLADSKVKHLKGFAEDLTVNDEVEIVSPKVTLKGPYSVNGNVLILPIVGKGNSEIVLENVSLLIKTRNKSYQKDGKTFLDFDGMKLEIKPKRVTFYLENLFNGNKELGDNMNRFINENWKEIFTELEPAISEAFALIVNHILRTAFSRYPYVEYFDNA